jgi:hypothetical protein
MLPKSELEEREPDDLALGSIIAFRLPDSLCLKEAKLNLRPSELCYLERSGGFWGWLNSLVSGLN